MMNLTDFLLARIAEDEAVARAAIAWLGGDERPWVDNGGGLETADGSGMAGYVGDDVAPHIANWYPARVLAECDAKRRIVEHHARLEWPDGELGCAVCGVDVLPPLDGVQVREATGWPCPTLGWLALPYTDHADYRPEWRP